MDKISLDEEALAEWYAHIGAIKDTSEAEQVGLPRGKLRESPRLSPFKRAEIDILHTESQRFPANVLRS
jgi:hypothetical protein